MWTTAEEHRAGNVVLRILGPEDSKFGVFDFLLGSEGRLEILEGGEIQRRYYVPDREELDDYISGSRDFF